jgi:phage tail tape-measure protein
MLGRSLLGSRGTRAAEPPLMGLPDLAAAAQRAKLRAYRDGLTDGMNEVLDQLEGRSKAQGPVPELTDDLRDWIVWVRANIDQAKAQGL